MIVVDDFIPYNKKFNSPAFAHSKVEGELWICLLEKAWAKVHGSYGMIINSYPELVLATLTNKPIQVINHTKK